MNLLSIAKAAERFSQSQPPINIEAWRCLRSRDKSSECDLCARLCPAGAIQLEGGVQLDADACIRCGLCLHLCPTEALSGEDGVHKLLFCASQLVDHEIVEIACAPHPDPASGDPKADGVISTSGCLAALGASAYLSLAAQGVQRTRVRLDACADCPLGALQPQIEAAAEQANHLLETLDRPERVEPAAPVARPKRRPVYSVKNPPVSRRGFFQALAHRDILPPLEAEHERERLIGALQRLAPEDALDRPVSGSGFASFTVSEACTACETCVRVCPTGALGIQKGEDAFQLGFSASACIDCGLCVKFCADGALERSGDPTVGDLIGDPVLLRSGALHRCIKCGGRYAGAFDEGYCPTCAFRRHNPFAVVKPPTH